MPFTITTSQFVDKFSLTVNEFTNTSLEQYIERYNEKVLVELLGKELYDLWDANQNNAPYDVLTNPFIWQSSCGKVYQSKGMLELSLAMIYFYYARDIIQQQSTNGAIRSSNENGNGMTFTESLIWQKYNEAKETYDAIQEYICENSDLYPTFKGVAMRTLIPFF